MSASSKNLNLATSLAATYVMYWERGDSTRALQAQHDALIRYALVTPKKWASLVKAEERSRKMDRLLAQQLMASRG
jgi:hypothetical protein